MIGLLHVVGWCRCSASAAIWMSFAEGAYGAGGDIMVDNSFVMISIPNSS
jgi:hypothetical protein